MELVLSCEWRLGRWLGVDDTVLRLAPPGESGSVRVSFAGEYRDTV